MPFLPGPPERRGRGRVLLSLSALGLALGLAPRVHAAPGRAPHLAAAAPSVVGYEAVLGQAPSASGVSTTYASCTAGVVALPGVGPRLITARHCGGAEPSVYDAELSVHPAARREIDGAGPDIAVLDVRGKLPWRPLEARSASLLVEGETLCAFRVSRAPGSFQREPVCGPYLGRTVRADGGAPEIVVGHVFEHGTSGSPLLDASGKVVGVVVATSAIEGFAEPIDEAARVAQGMPAPFGATRPGGPGGDEVWALPVEVPAPGSLCFAGLVCVRWRAGR